MLENLIFSFDEICFSISSELTTPNLHYNGHFFLPQKLFSQNRLILGELLKSPWKWTTQKNCCLREKWTKCCPTTKLVQQPVQLHDEEKVKSMPNIYYKTKLQARIQLLQQPNIYHYPNPRGSKYPNKNVFINSKTCRDVFKDTSTRSLQGFRSQCWTSTAFDTSQCTYILHTVRNLHFLFKKSIFGNFNFWKLNFGTKIRVFW